MAPQRALQSIMNRQLRNIGIFAHVDAGKTSLSEQLLAHAGAIRQVGSVDSGTAHTDNLSVEQRRGISVKATCVSFAWKDTTVNLIDTPGHVDFSAEVERSFWALDAAVLVICGVEGVQPQTEVLFHALREQHIPILLFINKMDREGADAAQVLGQIHRLLSENAALIGDDESMAEVVCAFDDDLLESYLSGETPDNLLMRKKLVSLVHEGRAYPVYTGSALRDMGVDDVLDGIVEFLPGPDTELKPLCGVVFAAKQDATLGRGAWVRLFGGEVENRTALTLPAGVDPVTGEEKSVQRKITQIRSVSGNDAGKLSAGEIAVIYGLGDISIGHIIGDSTLLPRKVEPGSLRTPLITVQAVPESPEQLHALREACLILSGEDPLLQARFVRSLNQLHLSVMGYIQLEILQEMLKTRFSLNVRFTDPAVIYRETILQSAKGFVAYTMPKPCWAIMEFFIEPAPRGSGVTFVSEVPERELTSRYQHQIQQALPLALAQGRLGWQVTDVKITLVSGNSHQWHTHPLDFIVATPMGIQDGLQRGGSQLLEPILHVKFLLPQDVVGRIISDIALMRGEVVETLTDGQRVSLTALLPVATSMDYSSQLASITGGRGSMTVRLHGYRECPLELGNTALRRNVDPLDTSKYILAARSALEGGIFEV
ncbi:MAG: TetM/TetW/TetO/TetS family tetracycline resistance ribosomal protection protein [Clostridiales bacterium]|nr:TetM/TetW/TetO/TetS family tetracycline resistance ribosomal protection protein [Clostridiales bacterium]